MSKFHITSYIAVGLLILIVGGLAFVLENAPLRIHISGVEGETGSVEFSGQRILLSSTNPIKTKEIESNLLINPEIDWRLTTTARGAELSFSQNLQPDTKYTIKVRKEVKDNYNRNLAEDFVFTFHTKPLRFVYVEKGENDRLVLTNLEGDKNNVFEARNIQLMAATRNHAAVVNQKSNGGFELWVIDLATKLSRRVAVIPETEIEISRLYASPTEEKIIFSAQPVELLEGIPLPKDSHKVFIYDFVNQSMTSPDISSQVGDILDVRFTPDGLGMLVHASEGDYFLFDLTDLNNFLIMGKHIETTGFSPNSRSIIWLDIPIDGPYVGSLVVNKLNSNREQEQLFVSANSVVDFNFVDEGRLLFAEQYQDLPGARGVYRIKLIDISTERITTLHNIEMKGLSLELPKASPSATHVIAEAYTSEQLLNYEKMRSFGYQTKPEFGALYLFDLKTGQQIKISNSAISAQWLR